MSGALHVRSPARQRRCTTEVMGATVVERRDAEDLLGRVAVEGAIAPVALCDAAGADDP